MEKLKVASMFCGCGGTDVGMQGGFVFLGKKYARNPVDIVYANDIDPVAAEIFNINFKIKCSVADIKDIKANSMPDHDILTGGFPCQSFSIVAQNPPRLGFKDERGMLFFEMCRILKAKKPAAFIAENVKGILSVNKGEAFPLIIKEFENCGYIVSWHLLNTADYGVPQRRERVFIVGIKKNLGKKFIPPEPSHSGKSDSALDEHVPLKEVIFSHKDVPQKYFFSPKAHEGLKKSNPAMNKGRAQDVNKVCNTVGAHLAKVSLNSTDPVLKVNGKFRRFMPREVARIQSFPDSFKLIGSESGQYRALGNAIPPVVMWYVTRQLIKILTKDTELDTRTSQEKRSFNMSRIRSQNTSIELLLNNRLKELGFIFETQVKDLPGKPDIVFKNQRIAVFCDSNFWHGKDYPDNINRIKTNAAFWKDKIQRNILRDRVVNQELEMMGWKVFRFWDDEIKKNTDEILIKIRNCVENDQEVLSNLKHLVS